MATNDDQADNTGTSRKLRQDLLLDDEFGLEPQQGLNVGMSKKSPAAKPATSRASADQPAAEVLSYRYDDKRTNNPHVGMVDTHSDGIESKTVWRYDQHIDLADRRGTLLVMNFLLQNYLNPLYGIKYGSNF